MPGADFKLFGEMAVVTGDAATALPAGRVGLVLALLLLDPGKPVSTDRLVDDIWGEEPGEGVDHTLRVTVSRLRSALDSSGVGGAVIETTPGGYVARVERASVDIAHFEDLVAQARGLSDDADVAAVLEQALDLWHGDPFSSLGDTPRLDEARRALREARADALDVWSGAASGEGRYLDVIAALESAVREYPYREHLWGNLAIALYHEGRQVAATRALQDARSALAETGLAVGQWLNEVESRILSGSVDTIQRRSATGNIPASVDSFIGREAELREIGDRFIESRLITLTGPGGSGKTRLALEFARERWNGSGAWFIDLAPTNDPEGLVDTFTASLGVGQHVSSGPLAAMVDQIGSSRSLLVVDNCEHVIDAAADIVGKLLARCPNVRVLATSREPLREGGETVLIVRSLDVPDDDGSETQHAESVRLFLDRADAASQQATNDDHAIRSVNRIVRMLDGIPLAIELAAVRTRTLSVDEIAERMDDVLSAVGAGPRTALPRHRTLRAAIDWSMSLLNEDERTAFTRLSTVPSDFGFDAAVAVSDLEPEATQTALDGLVEKSMLLRTASDARRYRFLEPLRQYGHAVLTEQNAVAEAEQRRNTFYASMVNEAGVGRRKDDPDWLQRMRVERPNVVAVAENLLGIDPESGATMIEVIAEYWVNLGWYPEGRRLVAAALGVDGISVGKQASVAGLGGMLALQQGDYLAAESMLETTLAEAEEHGLDFERARIMNVLGSLCAERGQMLKAAEWFRQCVDILGEAPAAMPSTVNLSAVVLWAGDVDHGLDLTERAEALVASDPNITIGHFAAAARGIAGRMMGDLQMAASEMDDAIAGFIEHRSEFHVGIFRAERALIAFEDGDIDRTKQITDLILSADAPGRTPFLPTVRARTLRARIAVLESGYADAVPDLETVLTQSLDVHAAWGVIECAEAAAELALVRDGQGARTAALLAEAASLREELGLARDAWEVRRYEQIAGDGGSSTERVTAAGLAERARRVLGDAM